MSEEWLVLCGVDAIAEGTGQRVPTPRGDFAVFNLGGVFFVTENACTHGPGNLGHGLVENGEVECEAHQGRFDIRTGKPTAPPCIEPLRVWDVSIRDGQVCIEFDQGRTLD